MALIPGWLGCRTGGRLLPWILPQDPGLGQRRGDLLRAVDEFDGGAGRQDQPRRRVTPAGHWGVRLHLVHAGDAEFEPQRLPVEGEVGDAVGEDLTELGAVDITQRHLRTLLRLAR